MCELIFICITIYLIIIQHHNINLNVISCNILELLDMETMLYYQPQLQPVLNNVNKVLHLSLQPIKRDEPERST